MTTFLEAVLNGWWQGILLTLLVWIVMRDLPRVSAATRLAIWQLTLLIVLLLPLLQGLLLPLWHDRASWLPTQATPIESTSANPLSELRQQQPLAPLPPRPLVEVTESNVAPALLAVALVLALFQLLRLAIGYWVSPASQEKRSPQRASPATTLIPQPKSHGQRPHRNAHGHGLPQSRNSSSL